MDVKAAVAFDSGKPLSIETVQLAPPQEGEVLVEIKATGVCYTDAYTLSGAAPEGLFPTILGHEGAGVVVEIGKGVTNFKPGDHVIPLYIPECRQCPYCLSMKTNLCQAIRNYLVINQSLTSQPGNDNELDQVIYHYKITQS